MNGGRVVFEADASAERKLVHNLRRRMDQLDGAVRAVTLVVRTILCQSNLDGREKGGLSGTAIALMVAAAAATVMPISPPPACVVAGELLTEVLKVYSKWDWSNKSVALVSYNDHSRQHQDDPVSVCTPFSGEVNLASGCKRHVQISAMLSYAQLATAQWEKPDASATEINCRGVTPLSSVVAHKDLWDRSHLIRRSFPTHPSSSDFGSSFVSSSSVGGIGASIMTKSCSSASLTTPSSVRRMRE